MAAALSASRSGADVAVVSRLHPIRALSCADEVLNELSREALLEAGQGLADEHAIDRICTLLPGVVDAAERRGARLAHPATAHHLATSLARELLAAGVPIYEDHSVLALDTASGRCCGAVCWDFRAGVARAVSAASTVLATGGSPGGLIAAFRSGVPLRDAEMIEFDGSRARFRIGGVSADTHGRTPIVGLFAAGEAASTGVHGATVLPGASLAEALACGDAAGAAAASDATLAGTEFAFVSDAAVRASERSLQEQFDATSNERAATARASLAELERTAAGPTRSAGALTDGLTSVRALKTRLRATPIRDRALRCNAELVSLLDLQARAQLAECVLTSALGRTETRGTHVRTDFPTRDDERWQRHTLAWHDADAARLGYAPVRSREIVRA